MYQYQQQNTSLSFIVPYLIDNSKDLMRYPYSYKINIRYDMPTSDLQYMSMCYYEWLTENINNDDDWAATFEDSNHNDLSMVLTILFKRVEDLTAFKLRWI